MRGRDRTGLSRRDVLRLSVAGAAGWALGGCRGGRVVADPGVPVLAAETLPAWRLPEGRLLRPAGVAWLKDGLLACAESGRHRMRVFGGDGRLEATWGRAGSGPRESSEREEWNDPRGLALLGRDRLLVTDSGNGVVVPIDTVDEFFKDGPTSWEKSAGFRRGTIGACGIDDREWLRPEGLAIGPIDPEGAVPQGDEEAGLEPEKFHRLLVVADAGNRRVKVCRLDGTPRAFCWDGNVAPPVIRRPEDVAVLASGLVAIADPLAGAVRAFQLVVTDVRVAFAEPGATEIPTAGRRVGLRRDGFTGSLRLTAAGERLLIAHAEGVTVCDANLAPVGRIGATALGGLAPLAPGGIAYHAATQALAVSDAASGTILRARVAI